MGIEIERKYLVNKRKWEKLAKADGQYYRQGYISTDLRRTIRIRLAGNKGFLTIKGLSIGATRHEFEYEIPEKDAKELLEYFCTFYINKIRHKIYHTGKLWEVDEFLDDNEGLIIAEIELRDEGEKFSLPDWIDKELTGQEKYFNANLSINPYKNWRD